MSAGFKPSRFERRQLERDNAKRPPYLVPVPREEWPARIAPSLHQAFRSRDFLVQVFAEPRGILRLSVCRTSLAPGGERWADQISWDELQQLKYECGYGTRMAVEIYPERDHTVNVANMRHLWILPEPLDFAWRKR